MGEQALQLVQLYETRGIREHLGCTHWGCIVTGRDDVGRLGHWVRHNGVEKFFGDIGRQSGDPAQHDAWLLRDVAAWTAEQHREMEAREIAARQAAIDADGWLQHGCMVALSAEVV